MMELLSATRKLHGKSREFPQNNLLTLSLDAAFNFQFALVRSYSNDTDPIEMCQELKRFYERSMDLAREHFRFLVQRRQALQLSSSRVCQGRAFPPYAFSRLHHIVLWGKYRASERRHPLQGHRGHD